MIYTNIKRKRQTKYSGNLIWNTCEATTQDMTHINHSYVVPKFFLYTTRLKQNVKLQPDNVHKIKVHTRLILHGSDLVIENVIENLCAVCVYW
jgi:hypothetical protein